MKDKKAKDDNHWKDTLTPEQYKVLREKGTEAPFSGKYVDHKEDGMYHCAACGALLYSSDEKFDSGTGWPSFSNEVEGAIEYKEDTSIPFQPRTEAVCKNCGSHLGHVFSDGPKEGGGARHCINSCALDFKKK